MTENSPRRPDSEGPGLDHPQGEPGGPSGLHDYSAEHKGLRETHQHVHDGLANADPTGSRGKPLLLAGFIIVMLVVLAAMLLIGTVRN